MANKNLKQRANNIREGLDKKKENRDKLSEEKETTTDKNLKDKEIVGSVESRLGDKKRERKIDKTKTDVSVGERNTDRR